jgi:hypothetical protein
MSTKLRVISKEKCLCCDFYIGIDENGNEFEIGYVCGRCPRCGRFIDIDQIKYVNQICLNCWAED